MAQDARKQLDELRAQSRTPKSREMLETERTALRNKHSADREERGALVQKLNDDDEKRARLGNKLTEIRAQEGVFNDWNLLNSYLGSADGKKFRRYAQSLTFRKLIDQANSEMRHFDDRYELVAAKDKDFNLLDFSIRDKWMNNEVRSVDNLSGGETFLVSLALALGLSGMARGSADVDTLFLDEGFGTLDQESLDRAIGALADLTKEGTIGIISHVDSLKEKVDAQIELVKGTNGHSTLTGPGCRRLDGSGTADG